MARSPHRSSLITRIIAILGGLATAATLAACGGGDEEKPAATGPGPAGEKPSGNIRILYQGNADQSAIFEDMVDRFNVDYPDVKVEVVADPSPTWDAFFASVQVKLSGGQKFDLVYVPTEGELLFASKGVLQPLDAWAERDKEAIDAFADAANPKILEWAKTKASPDGKTYFIPFDFNTMCIYYNKQMFADAGITPNPDWTWDEFYDVAQKLTVEGKVNGFHAPVEYFAGIMPWLLTNDANVLNDDWTESTVNSPEAVEAVTFVRKLVEDGISRAPSATFNQYDALVNGEVAMIGGGRWPTRTLRDQADPADYGILPWPQHTTQGSPVGWGAYGMLKDSANKDAAWAFITFLLEEQTQDYIGESLYGDATPALETSAISAASLDNSPEGTEYLYEALEYATPVPGPDKSNLIQQAVQDTYNQILLGEVDPGPALDALNTKVQQALESK